jgi:hypothetical protein
VLPEFASQLALLQRRLRLASLAAAVIPAAAGSALIATGLMLAGASNRATRVGAALTFAVTAIAAGVVFWRRWTAARVAAYAESRTTLHNIVITAQEIASMRHPAIGSAVRDEVLREAASRLQMALPAIAVSLPRALILPVLMVAAAAVFLTWLPTGVPATTPGQQTARATAAPSLAAGQLRVIVAPPTYTGRPIETAIDPAVVTAVEGSRIRIETARSAGRVSLSQLESAGTPAFREESNLWVAEFSPAESVALVVTYSDLPRDIGTRVLQVRVEPDARPAVRIRTPARDLLFADSAGVVPLEIEAQDDIGLQWLRLRYTRVSGSGETFTFEEGDVPLDVNRSSDTAWQARGRITLPALKLGDGDTVVYRALVADGKPGADPVASESYLIEIGRLAGAASTGFAVDEERDRQGLSQQMLIIKTERLHADRSRLTPAALLEQSRMLAVEQRMVRAEFVFMTGGEVADEVEEAEHAHELAEGRLENQSQVELLTAIREMSRAEARLNAADTATALQFERAALRALQRAFDRRRYLLRTMPERTRIDPARRLSGERAEARPSPRDAVAHPADAVVGRARQAMAALSVEMSRFRGVDPAAAAVILRVDPSSERLQALAARLAAAATRESRRTVAEEAQRELAALLRSRLAAPATGRVPGDPLQGRVADFVRGSGQR